jgi:hypothetical protein
MKSRFNLIQAAASVLIAMGLSLPALADTKTNDNLAAQQKGVELINQVGDVALDIRYNAEHLDSFNKRMQISERSHTYHLNQIKALVNDGLNPALAQLEDLQAQLPDWKQQTIDSMLDSAKALAADANSAILERNESHTASPAMNPEYKALVKQVEGHAQNLIETSDAAAAYASSQLKAQEAGISVPSQS